MMEEEDATDRTDPERRSAAHQPEKKATTNGATQQEDAAGNAKHNRRLTRQAMRSRAQRMRRKDKKYVGGNKNQTKPGAGDRIQRSG